VLDETGWLYSRARSWRSPRALLSLFGSCRYASVALLSSEAIEALVLASHFECKRKKGVAQMSVKAGLWKRSAMALAALAAMAVPTGANASLLGGFSIRVGALFPSQQAVRDISDVAMYGAGIDYKVGFIPKLLNGEAWSTSISVDGFYAGRKAGVVRDYVAAINQVYTFEEQGGHSAYAGFDIAAHTFGGTLNDVEDKSVARGTTFVSSGHQPMVTRFGGGLIVGMNFSKSLYLQAQYDWVDRHHTFASPEGFRAMVGWRF
jgi:hypothetical protein